MPADIRVVGAVIVQDGLVLCAQRGLSSSLPNLWEFPGGKIEGQETEQDALVREISEELGISVRVGRKITSTRHRYEFGSVFLTTFYCQINHGSPESIEHASLVWLQPDELSTLEWAPADIPAVAIIQADFQ